VKAHRCLEIARRQRDLGARGITVSCLAAAAGFDRVHAVRSDEVVDSWTLWRGR
jgi:D-serine deaminase-like pyridoxal phosphate-dependent protein